MQPHQEHEEEGENRIVEEVVGCQGCSRQGRIVDCFHAYPITAHMFRGHGHATLTFADGAAHRFHGALVDDLVKLDVPDPKQDSKLHLDQ